MDRLKRKARAAAHPAAAAADTAAQRKAVAPAARLVLRRIATRRHIPVVQVSTLVVSAAASQSALAAANQMETAAGLIAARSAAEARLENESLAAVEGVGTPTARRLASRMAVARGLRPSHVDAADVRSAEPALPQLPASAPRQRPH